MSRITYSRCWLVAFALASALLSAQTAPRNDRVVTVDVVATDSAGQPVRGLTQQDFKIFENKKPQQIRTFKIHQPELIPNSAPSSLPENTFTNAGSHADEKPITVILLDQMNTSIHEQELARREVIKFFQLKPVGASFAIVAIRNDTVACQDKGIASWTIASTPDRTWDAACSARGKLIFVQGVTDSSEQLLAAMNSELAQPHSTFYRTKLANWLSPVSAPKHTPLLIRFFGGPMPSPLREDTYKGQGSPGEVSDSSMSSLAELGSFLDGLPGRKNLVWLAGDFDAAPIAQSSDHLLIGRFKGWERADPFSAIDMDHVAADRLRLARVAIYPVDLTGKNNDIEIHHYCDRLEFDPLITTLYWFNTPSAINSFTGCVITDHGIKVSQIAEYSGGRAFHGPDRVQAALAQAVADNQTYYTLTYSPAGPKFNGKNKEVRVEADRPDVHSTYRKFYFADDPASVVRPDATAVYDVNMLNPNPGAFQNPWIVLRVPYTPDPDANDPARPSMHYGAAPSHDLVFAVHLELTHRPQPATPEQMDDLAQYDSYLPERVTKAMENLTAQEKKSQRKGHTLLDTLPTPDPEMLDPYTIEYSIPVKQLSSDLKHGKLSVDIEVALEAYDSMGRKVTGLKTEATGKLSKAETQAVLESSYRLEQKIDLPERATTIRVAVRNARDAKMGSLEIPLWAVTSPYKRKQLPFPTELSDATQKPH